MVYKLTSYPVASAVFYRSYSRQNERNEYETWMQSINRSINGLVELGKLSESDAELLRSQALECKALPSGRWMWCGGSEWIEKQENFYGGYNCTSNEVDTPEVFGWLMNLAMQGCGTGAILEQRCISKLPKVNTRLNLRVIGEFDDEGGDHNTTFYYDHDTNSVRIVVGDSRSGWVSAYQKVIDLAFSECESDEILVEVDISNVRKAGKPLKKFGGTSNPIKLPELFPRIAEILNGAVGRQLTADECCLVIDEAALVVVAGNIRRCLAADTLVTLADFTTKQIKDISAGDMVLSYDIDNDKYVEQMVTSKFYQGVQKVTRIYFDVDDYVEATEKHRFLCNLAGTNGDTWVKVEILQVGDKLCLQNESPINHTQITKIVRDITKVETWDIEVENTHCFFANGVLSHNSAAIKQFDKSEKQLKLNLWQQGEDGSWKIDPKKDALRMSNHTRVYHRKPTLKECIDAVQLQFESGEGAIQYVNEAIARANADLFPNREDQITFIQHLEAGTGERYLTAIGADEIEHRLHRYGLNPCGEIIGSSYHCNLSEVHLNRLNPYDLESQKKSFQSGALSVAILLNHEFENARWRHSREIDPIVGVSLTGLFDFFVNAFGRDWLEWWQQDRNMNFNKSLSSNDQQLIDLFDCRTKMNNLAWELQQIPNKAIFFKVVEREYLELWKNTAFAKVKEYCEAHGLKVPNRCTTIQPAGCLTVEALRIFDQGLFYADEHMEPAWGDCNINGLSVRNGKAIIGGISNEKKNLIRVTLNNGRQITMTPDHRLSINGRWVESRNLSMGDKLDYQIGNYRKASEPDLIYVDVTTPIGRPHRGCNLPEKMSPDLAYFVGCLFANGCMCSKNYRIRFSHGNKTVLERLSEISNRLFGVVGLLTRDARNGGNRYELCIANKQLFSWFEENGLNKAAKSKDIYRTPYLIRCSSRESILNFFAGMIDCDGCIRKEGSLSIDLASEDFIRELQQIGEAVGLSFSIFHNTEGENLQETKNMFGLCLSRMVSNQDAIDTINKVSIKAKTRPIPTPKRIYDFDPYKITKIETDVFDYTYDYSVDGVDDDDSWYWQGAIKSHNSKSLLSNASPGWHPPKATRYIRRVTFRKDDPVALAHRDMGFNLVPSQSDKDEQGNLLNDPYDPRCTEWLVEIPVEMSWANMAEGIDISKFSALAQFDFYMQVQKFYTSHNTSATIELREHEVTDLAIAIHDAIKNNEGYISAALLARFDVNETFPRLPFEPISKKEYGKLVQEVQQRKITDDFIGVLNEYAVGRIAELSPSGCDSDACMLPMKK